LPPLNPGKNLSCLPAVAGATAERIDIFILSAESAVEHGPTATARINARESRR
jgi:hypothetical protein